MKVESVFASAGGAGEKKDESSNEQKIVELKKRREGITAFNDVTSDDRKILEEIDKSVEDLENDRQREFEEEKKKLFATIDIMEGAYSPTNNQTIEPEKMKKIIDAVLEGAMSLNAIPRSPVFGREENLREAVDSMMTDEK